MFGPIYKSHVKTAGIGFCYTQHFRNKNVSVGKCHSKMGPCGVAETDKQGKIIMGK
jgi:hypothetical protein